MKQLFRAVLGAVQEEVLRCLLFLLLLSSFQLVILIWRKFEDQSGVLAPRELPFFFFFTFGFDVLVMFSVKELIGGYRNQNAM